MERASLGHGVAVHLTRARPHPATMIQASIIDSCGLATDFRVTQNALLRGGSAVRIQKSHVQFNEFPRTTRAWVHEAASATAPG